MSRTVVERQLAELPKDKDGSDSLLETGIRRVLEASPSEGYEVDFSIKEEEGTYFLIRIEARKDGHVRCWVEDSAEKMPIIMEAMARRGDLQIAFHNYKTFREQEIDHVRNELLTKYGLQEK